VGGPSDDGTHRDMGYVQAFEVQEWKHLSSIR
jgi:hypothetical protein